MERLARWYKKGADSPGYSNRFCFLSSLQGDRGERGPVGPQGLQGKVVSVALIDCICVRARRSRARSWERKRPFSLSSSSTRASAPQQKPSVQGSSSGSRFFQPPRMAQCRGLHCLDRVGSQRRVTVGHSGRPQSGLLRSPVEGRFLTTRCKANVAAEGPAK